MIHAFKFIGSSMLSECSYDDENNEMTIVFSNGRSYIYEDVDAEIYKRLVSAESAGRYFNSIKKDLKVKQ